MPAPFILVNRPLTEKEIVIEEIVSNEEEPLTSTLTMTDPPAQNPKPDDQKDSPSTREIMTAVRVIPLSSP